MALSGVAPTEKTENLIYLVLPLALSLTFAVCVAPNDPGVWWPIVLSVSPIGSLVLYQIGLDDWGVRAYYRHKIMNERLGGYKSADTLKQSFVVFHIKTQSWKGTFYEPLERSGFDSYIADEVAWCVGNTLSTSPVRKRLWRLRGSVYTLSSLPFLAFVGVSVLSALGVKLPNAYCRVLLYFSMTLIFGLLALETRNRVLGVNWNVFLPAEVSGLLAELICIVGLLPGTVQIAGELTALLFGTLAAIEYVRCASLSLSMRRLASYLYLRMLVATDATRRPDRYSIGKEGWLLKSELDSLETVLYRGDWPVFGTWWSRVCAGFESQAKKEFVDLFLRNAHEAWVELINGRIAGHLAGVYRSLWWFLQLSMWLAKALSAPPAQGPSLDSRSSEFLEFLIDRYPEPSGVTGLVDPYLLCDKSIFEADHLKQVPDNEWRTKSTEEWKAILLRNFIKNAGREDFELLANDPVWGGKLRNRKDLWELLTERKSQNW